MIRLIQFALRRPVTIIVLVVGIILFSVLAIRKSAIDIFPTINVPTIYVAQTYGGLSPQQMEGFITSYYEYHFLYITGIKAVESKSIQGLALIKLQFHEGTNMAAAMAEVISYANRAKSFMPPGTVPPFVMRYDAGSVPVGQLVFSSEGRSLNEIQDLALFKVRPMFASLPGVSAPPPFGGNQRTILVKADPERLRSYNITADELVASIAKNNPILPAGNIRVGDKAVITSSNSVVDNFKELEASTVKNINGTAILVRDVATVDNGADVTTGYALINGKRSVYIPVTKRADASTWDVVQAIKKALPDMQAAIPEDIKVSYEFDQSGYVINSLKSLMFEGLLGSLLTGLMVLLFLRDLRSALIVIINIPLALLTSVVCLYLTGQTINIMTLGGLALSVGILVDESTVTIENIHHHLELGTSRARAIWDACSEIAVPKLLILFSILAVFVPALFMTGVPRSMFLPLSMAVGFAMIASFLLSQTLVPVLSNWLLKKFDTGKENKLSNIKQRLSGSIKKFQKSAAFLAPLIIVVLLLLAYVGFKGAGTEIFPKVDAGQMQVRLRKPAGTRIERTEDATKKLLQLIEDSVGSKNVAITSSFVGLQPPTYAINPIFLYTSGPHESVIKVNLSKSAGISIQRLKEELRSSVTKNIPQAQLSFEPADLVDQIMSLGSDNPVEVVVQGKNLAQSRDIAEKLKSSLNTIPYLRDVQIAQPLDYPTIQINYDRIRTGQMDLSVDQAGRSVTEGTSSSRLTQPVYWLDKASGNAYQVQVEYPQLTMNSPEQVEQIPVGRVGGNTIYLRDIADWKKGNSIGEYDRINQQRFITVTADIHKKDLGNAVADVNKAIKQLGELPQGVKVYQRGQSEVLDQTTSELSIGLLLAIIVIGLMLAAYFQSLRLSIVILSVFPGVLAGSLLLLWATGNTLNIQSFMGCIMAIGVAVANSILLVSNAESIRYSQANPVQVGSQAAANRLRPIIMTSVAMIAGMIPMAIGLGEGGKQTAPLAIAVIGGLLFSTFISLWLIPLVYDLIIGRKRPVNISLDPNDENSVYYDK
ncbi:acriflavin resistance protein [Niastella koreensis]|uniref:Acriflavin resistance protein n=2 Tax=Niastella koreensis TaxID=354356 RepID=G8TRG2_NIAKG|nr:efflux RND transporter permease subunit [Niastella koreensis]AEW01093.1 acriflavin resistance protein [Niastella koreensis GR20-10]OQP41810.1 acriflavin resistance protein [Niastella koreensis]